MNLVYNVSDRPPIAKNLVYALQQLLAILAATIAVPAIIGNGMSQAAALFGAGVGTLIYLAFTKFKSPVFLGSSFAFLGSMSAAFAGAASISLGYLGLIIGACFAGLVYVIIAIVIKFCGTAWISKIMPPVVIGPTVAIIGLSLAGNAIGDLGIGAGNYAAIICGIITLLATIVASVYGRKTIKMIPFIIGIGVGYVLALIFTLIGIWTKTDSLKLINFYTFANMKWLPEFGFIKALNGFGDLTWGYIGTIALAYIPVATVVFAEHIADHRNLSTIINSNLLEEPGLHRTLLGDGIGSIGGAFFGCCPNTSYGEAIACVAISGNASTFTIFLTACMAIVASFIAPFMTLLATIPACVMGGVCIALYGFIAVSGLKMLQPVDLNDNRNLFVASTILIAGVGGFSLTFGKITITTVACALLLGILVNFIVRHFNKEEKESQPEETIKEN